METRSHPTGGPDLLADVAEFTDQYCQQTNKPRSEQINGEYIAQMVADELEELRMARDEAEQVDALLDICYYCLQHLSMAQVNTGPLWKLVHEANMRKFGPGGYRRESDGKWCKPEGFVPPDEEIRAELTRQRRETQETQVVHP